MEILIFGFSSNNSFFVSFAQRRRSGCSKPLVLLRNVFVVTAPQWLIGICMQGGCFFLPEQAFGDGEGCQGIFYFHLACLANDLQLQANTAIIQEHVFFHLLITELIYSFASMYRLYFLLTDGSLDWMKWKDLVDKWGTDSENRRFIECSQWQWILQYAMNGKNLNECRYTSVCGNNLFSHTDPLYTLSFNMTYSESKTETILHCK